MVDAEEKPEPPTKAQIVASLEQRRDLLLSAIASQVRIRASANDRIRGLRDEVADVERMMRAAKPRRGKRRPPQQQQLPEP